MRGLNFPPPTEEDTAWFEENIVPLRDDLRACAAQLTSKEGLVQDALQDALITLWARGREEHVYALGPVEEYAASVVYGWILNGRRQRREERSKRETATDPMELPPSEEADLYAGTFHVEELISKVEDEERRELLFLYHVARRSQTELAKHYGVSQPAVVKRLRVAHRELQEPAASWL